jgi:hypothetical protein
MPEGVMAESLGRCVQVFLALRIGIDAIAAWRGLRRQRLPDLVINLGRHGGVPKRSRDPLDPARLGRLVYRVMNVEPFRPRCLTMSLVLLRGLGRQGTPAELVLGLPPGASDHRAHAWVEVGGKVVGPPPGRMGHVELARYPVFPRESRLNEQPPDAVGTGPVLRP